MRHRRVRAAAVRVTGPICAFVRDRLRGLSGVEVVGTADEVTPSTAALRLS